MAPKNFRSTTLLLATFLGLGTLLFSAATSAVGTRSFVLQNGKDYEGGDLKGVAVDSAGRVRAGFNLGTTPVSEGSAIWSVLPLGGGSVLLGTGNEGKLLRLDGAKVSVAAETGALVITSMAKAGGNSVVLGTLPDGKLFRFDGGKLSELATLKDTEHVWQVAYDPKTRSVFAATGPEGKLYRIADGAEPQVYFDADEQHLMSVAVAPDGTIYAGASDKAKLYKITGPGRASVLYDFGRTEVRAIAIGDKGQVFAIANEIKPGARAPKRKTKRNESSPAKPTSTTPPAKGKGTLFRFEPDGTHEQLLDNSDEHFVSLALGDDGAPYVGTGAEGRVYTVDASHNSVLVADVEERQVTALVVSGAQKLLATGDPAVVHPVRGIGGVDAVWTSKVFDGGIRARFGRMSWEASGALEFSTRTGNTEEPDDTWSDWSKPMVTPSVVESPPARYFQVRARWSRDTDAVLNELTVPFVTDNLRAVVTEISVSSGAKSKGKGSSNDKAISESGGPVSDKPDSGVELNWKVDNPDQDALRYRLQYRLVGTTTWYDMLKPHEPLTKESFSWDTADLPEGRYRVRLIATDEFSNPPNRVKRDELESGVVLVDNTPPIIDGLKAVGRRVQGTAIDGVGPIHRIEIAVAGSNEWFPFYPTDGIFDESSEAFDADVSAVVPAGPALLSVRVYDEAKNFVVRHVALR